MLKLLARIDLNSGQNWQWKWSETKPSEAKNNSYQALPIKKSFIICHPIQQESLSEVSIFFIWNNVIIYIYLSVRKLSNDASQRSSSQSSGDYSFVSNEAKRQFLRSQPSTPRRPAGIPNPELHDNHHNNSQDWVAGAEQVFSMNPSVLALDCIFLAVIVQENILVILQTPALVHWAPPVDTPAMTCWTKIFHMIGLSGGGRIIQDQSQCQDYTTGPPRTMSLG